jgi:hypothetical protein
MNTTTEPALYDLGPSELDLRNPNSVWAIDPATVVDYVTAAHSITRADWRTVEDTLARDGAAIGLRDLACELAGQPLETVTVGARDGRPYRTRAVDDQTYYNPRANWPDGLDPHAWTMHYLVLIPRVEQTRAARIAATNGAALVHDLATCAACGTSDPALETAIVERHGNAYRFCIPCRTALDTINAERALTEKINGKTRRAHVERWIEAK